MKTPSTPSTAQIAGRLASAVGGLGLHQQAYLVVGGAEIVAPRAPARRACDRGADAADAFGRIARGGDQRARLLGRVDHRHQQVLHADVEQLLDERRLAGHRAHHRLRRVGGHRLQLRQRAAHVVGRVFAVDQQPLEARGGAHLGRVGLGQRKPQADLRPLGRQRLLEEVVHRVRSVRIVRSVTPSSVARPATHGSGSPIEVPCAAGDTLDDMNQPPSSRRGSGSAGPLAAPPGGRRRRRFGGQSSPPWQTYLVCR